MDSTGLVILCSGSEKSMRHFPHNSRYCGKCFRETEEFLSYRVLAAVFQCDRIFGRDRYVFPHAEGLIRPDPTKPMTGWRTAWRNLTRAISCPKCGELQKPGEKCGNKECGADVSKVKSPTHGLRFHDMRHHAITELAESQASDQTIMSIAGHVSPKMLAHYSHVRMEAKRKALDALASVDSGGSYGTKHGTNLPGDSKQDSQVLENMVDERGFEPPASSLRTRRSPS